MRAFDFSSFSGLLTTLIGLALFALIGIGMRLLIMLTVQQRRERRNRQINERLKTLIAAYKTLGGSFTGNLAVDPTHMRDLRRTPPPADAIDDNAENALDGTEEAVPAHTPGAGGSDRSRRIRDAVEAALSDVILLGTAEHVRLAERAARDLVAGRQVHIDELVVSLRDYIRKTLDLDPVPADLQIPRQGPLRPVTSGGRSSRNADRTSGTRQGQGGGAAGGGGAGVGFGLAAGSGGDGPDGTP